MSGTPHAISARNQRIVAMVKAGIKMSTVADNFGVSPSTVTYVCREAGVSKKRVGPAEAGLTAATGITDPQERKRAYRKAYDKARYATKKYRDHMRDYARERYARDPLFRERRIEAVKRHRERKAAKGRPT